MIGKKFRGPEYADARAALYVKHTNIAFFVGIVCGVLVGLIWGVWLAQFVTA